MMIFDVKIESPEDPTLRLLVTADTWVAAWKEALLALGDPALPADAACTVATHRVVVEVPSLGRFFVISPLNAADTFESSLAPSPGRPLLVADDGTAVALNLGPRRPTDPRRTPARAGSSGRNEQGRKTPPAAPDLQTAVRLAEDPALDPQPARARPRQNATADPIARVLSDLERQRLLARPVRISVKTGLPTPVESAATPHRPIAETFEARPKAAQRPPAIPVQKVRDDLPRLDIDAPWDKNLTTETGAPTGMNRPRARRQATPINVPRAGESTAPGLHRDDDARADLPQQFRPVQLTAAPPAGEALFAWAADTAWQHVPSMLALVLSEGPKETLTVVAARGEREREASACRLVREGPRGQSLCRVANRIRYSEAIQLRFAHPDGRTWELRVHSALCTPVELATSRSGAAPRTDLRLLVLNAPRPTGFTDGEASALAYLARTIAQHLD